MKGTLQIGDHVFVNKLSYGFRLVFMAHTMVDYDLPERKNIVVFTLPEIDSVDILKRVIGAKIKLITRHPLRTFITSKEGSCDKS